MKNIELNHRPYPWSEGMTVISLMEENNFTHGHIIVKINGVKIEKDMWPDARVKPGDKVEMIHIFSGG